MKKMKIGSWLILSLAFKFLEATDYTPWLGNVYEFEWRNSLLYQSYPGIAVGAHLQKNQQSDLFYSLSLANSLPDFGLEIEMNIAKTHRQNFDLDHLKMNARTVWLDDIAGDPVSLTTGICLSKAFWSSLKDLSSFHHGLGEAELFVSIGKEQVLKADKIIRYWMTTGIGCAERGSPWVHLDLSSQARWGNHQWEPVIKSLWGLGNNKLSSHHFKGYGAIDHRSIDISLKYSYLINFFGETSLEYSYRVYAYNFPAHTHRATIQLLYTFGL